MVEFIASGDCSQPDGFVLELAFVALGVGQLFFAVLGGLGVVVGGLQLVVLREVIKCSDDNIGFLLPGFLDFGDVVFPCIFVLPVLDLSVLLLDLLFVDIIKICNQLGNAFLEGLFINREVDPDGFWLGFVATVLELPNFLAIDIVGFSIKRFVEQLFLQHQRVRIRLLFKLFSLNSSQENLTGKTQLPLLVR
jgi:hypothetical protein